MGIFHQFDEQLEFGKELRFTSISAPNKPKIPNFFSDKLILINAFLGHRTLPFEYTDDKFFEKCDVFICSETLHSKSLHNFSLFVIKLTEITSETQVFLDEIFQLGNDDVIRSLYVKHRHFVTKSLSAKTRITRILGILKNPRIHPGYHIYDFHSKNDNFGLKMKFLNFLGIKPILRVNERFMGT